MVVSAGAALGLLQHHCRTKSQDGSLILRECSIGMVQVEGASEGRILDLVSI